MGNLYVGLIIVVSLIPAVYGIFRRRKKLANKGFNAPVDSLTDVILPLTVTFVGVLLALMINRFEMDRIQRDEMLNMLTVCEIDATNASNRLELARSIVEEKKLRRDSAANEIKSIFNTYEGLPFPNALKNIISNETALSKCTKQFLIASTLKLNALESHHSRFISLNIPNELYMKSVNNYWVFLQDIKDMIACEIKFIEGQMSRKEHDNYLQKYIDELDYSTYSNRK